jgi:cellulose synthase/poly-beta-1,6-N-acetylglucosamine synthase-like glycosyltransferase
LAAEVVALRRQLELVEASPGWRVILWYRQALRRAQWKHPRTYRIWAKAADWLIRTIRRQPAPAPIPPRGPLPGPDDLLYEDWIRLAEPSGAELERQRAEWEQFGYRPLISVVLPVYSVPLEVLQECVRSVEAQTYPNWELCVAHGLPDDTEARSYLGQAAAGDSRIRLRLLDGNAGISGNTNEALGMARGEYVAFVDHDDALAPFALFEVVRFLNQRPELDFIYSDSDYLSVDGARRYLPFFKPAWSPNLLLAVNYITHLSVVRRSVALELGGCRSECDGAQDLDFTLRLARRGARIGHIPKILYHWRPTASSAASSMEAKPYVPSAQLRCVGEHLGALGRRATPRTLGKGVVWLEWDPQHRPEVSILLVQDAARGRGRGLLRRWKKPPEGVREVIALGWGTTRTGNGSRIRAVEVEAGESLAEALNRVVREASAPVVLFLDAELEGEPGWLEELTGPFEDPAIAVVGAKLLDRRTGRLRHAGIVFNPDGEARNLFEGMVEGFAEPFGGDSWYRDVLAVSGACMAVRREAFLEAGGFESQPAYPRLDIDLCLRLRTKLEMDVLCNPRARLWQWRAAVLERWIGEPAPESARRHFQALFPEGDPFFNPNLVQESGGLRLRAPLGREIHDAREAAGMAGG